MKNRKTIITIPAKLFLNRDDFTSTLPPSFSLILSKEWNFFLTCLKFWDKYRRTLSHQNSINHLKSKEYGKEIIVEGSETFGNIERDRWNLHLVQCLDGYLGIWKLEYQQCDDTCLFLRDGMYGKGLEGAL